MSGFQLRLREDRPATIEEHRALRDDNAPLRAALNEVNAIANIAPADDSAGSLAVRMNKVWLLTRGYQA